jgi:hypothetical protein
MTAERTLARLRKAWSRGGKKGGPARARALSPERRREIARRAIAVRLGRELPDPMPPYPPFPDSEKGGAT